MPDMPAALGKMPFALPRLLGPLGLALLIGCASSGPVLRLEPGQHKPVVHLARGDRAPVDLDSEAFH